MNSRHSTRRDVLYLDGFFKLVDQVNEYTQ